MDMNILIEYGWTLLILIGLEGLLAADNALVMAIMVKHLPEDKQKKALFYGLFGAFLFRFGALFIISFLVNVWQLQALGALYLLTIGMNHIIRKIWWKKDNQEENITEKKQSGFWITVLKVELADLAFAVDSILAAVALVVVLPEIQQLPDIGGMNGGHFIVIFLGGIIGILMMRFAAQKFIVLLGKRPGLEFAAYGIVAWVGVKLSIYTLGHPSLHIIDSHFAHSTLWKIIFWSVLLAIFLLGWIFGKEKNNLK